MYIVKEEMNEEEKERRRKGPWTPEEDMQLLTYISLHAEGRWNFLARAAGLKRSGKSCRLRWVNYLRPDIKRGNITPEEERLIIDLQSRWGNRWSQIAQRLPGRTDNEIKNYWRTRIKRRFKMSSTGNGPSYHSMYSTCLPNSFLHENSREEMSISPKTGPQQTGAFNNKVIYVNEESHGELAKGSVDSIRVPNGMNNSNDNCSEQTGGSEYVMSFAGVFSDGMDNGLLSIFSTLPWPEESVQEKHIPLD